jgi:CRAL/TRIO domain
MKDDLRALEIGTLQVIRRRKTNESLDERDMLYVDPGKLDPTKYTRESGWRAFWYYFHSLLEDEQVQKRGLVVITYCANYSTKNRDPPFGRMCVASLKGSLPIRMSAFHGCHPPSVLRWVARIMFVFIGERMRKRVLPHTGSQEHVVSLLETKFGIPRNCIPKDMGGNRDMDLRAWLAERRAVGL